MSEIDKDQKSIQNATLAVILITNFASTFAASSINIAVPHIGKEFSASATSLAWIVLAFLMVSALLSIPMGRIADISGRMPIFKGGMALFCIAAFCNIFAPNMTVFLLFRVLQGVGSAMIFATNSAILMDVFPADKRGSVLGIAVAAVFTGSSCGPVIGGLITHAFGWRAVFIAIAALALTAFIVALVRSPKEAKIERKQKISSASIFFYVISLGALMYGLVTLFQNVLSYAMLAAGVILVILFIKRETRTEIPVIEMRLFRHNRIFVLSNLAALFNFAAIFAVLYLMSIYLQIARGFSADVSGLIMISQPAIQAVLSPIAGRLSDRKSPALIASIGMAFCAGALFVFAFVGLQTSIPYVLAGMILTGVGISFFSSPNANVIYSSVSNKDFGVAASMLSTVRTFGQVMGMAILTIIINKVIGNIPIENVAPSAIVHDMQISFFVFTAICIIGILFSVRRRP